MKLNELLELMRSREHIQANLAAVFKQIAWCDKDVPGYKDLHKKKDYLLGELEALGNVEISPEIPIFKPVTQPVDTLTKLEALAKYSRGHQYKLNIYEHDDGIWTVRYGSAFVHGETMIEAIDRAYKEWAL